MHYGGIVTSGVTGKGETWQTKPPDAESAIGAIIPKSEGNAPHLSGARGVGPFYCAKPIFSFLLFSFYHLI